MKSSAGEVLLESDSLACETSFKPRLLTSSALPTRLTARPANHVASFVVCSWRDEKPEWSKDRPDFRLAPRVLRSAVFLLSRGRRDRSVVEELRLPSNPKREF